jgi:hypothetical protein
MSRFEATETIERPSDEVWAYASDILRHPDWMSVVDAEVLQGDGTEVGARGRERVVLGPIKCDISFEVAAAEPGRLLLWRALEDRRFHVWEVGLELESLGSRTTRATYHGELRMRGRWRILSPLVAIEGPAGVRKELRLLKDAVEATHAGVPRGADAA